MTKQNPVRMGVLNILMMVIVLSLAVMAVLALVTAHAGKVLNERQADEMQQVYALETAGQQFLSSVDAQLQWLAQNDTRPQQMLRALDAAAWGCAQSAISTQQAIAAGVSADAYTLDPEHFGASLDSLNPKADTVGLMMASFTTDKMQNLTCTLAINSDATYEVLTWKQTKLWSDEAPQEKLLTTN